MQIQPTLKNIKRLQYSLNNTLTCVTELATVRVLRKFSVVEYAGGGYVVTSWRVCSSVIIKFYPNMSMKWRMPRLFVSPRSVQRGANPALDNIRFWSNLSRAADQRSALRGKLIVLVYLSDKLRILGSKQCCKSERG
jgi:hypothetical protein